jgi:hypothetical protein
MGCSYTTANGFREVGYFLKPNNSQRIIPEITDITDITSFVFIIGLRVEDINSPNRRCCSHVLFYRATRLPPLLDPVSSKELFNRPH